MPRHVLVSRLGIASTVVLGLVAAGGCRSCRSTEIRTIGDGQRLAIAWPLVLPCGDFSDGEWSLEDEVSAGAPAPVAAAAAGERGLEWIDHAASPGAAAVRWSGSKGEPARVPLDVKFPVARADGIVVHLPDGARATALRVVLRCREPAAGSLGAPPPSDVHWRCADGACTVGARYSQEAPPALEARCDYAALARMTEREREADVPGLLSCGRDVVREIDAVLTAACATPERCAKDLRETAEHVHLVAAATDWTQKQADPPAVFTVSTAGAMLRLACERAAPDAACEWRAYFRRGHRVRVRYELGTRLVFGTAADGSGAGDGSISIAAPLDPTHFSIEGSAIATH